MVKKFVRGFVVMMPQHQHIINVPEIHEGLFMEGIDEALFKKAHEDISIAQRHF